MINKIPLALILVFTGLAASCLSASSNAAGGKTSAKTLELVQNAVFEVVVEKPVDDPAVYERTLNWDNVPFAIRNDKYYSIGTAFAISKTELITAFHVVKLGHESMVFEKYFIRDSKGEVFEIDQVTGGSREKDFLIFTVKGRTFNQTFQFERNYKIGDTVLSIGNALGEGIVVRNGLVLGTVPEEDSGRWDLLKSSADGNPGNSGGPLVTPNGKVVALVTALRDNILYSIPTSVILDSDRAALPYRARGRFGHLLLPNKYDDIYETSVSLPASYVDVRKKIREGYLKYYDNAMSSLFKEAPEYLTGQNNVYLLQSSLSSSFPELSFIDPNDNNWKMSDLKARTYSLENDGSLMHINISGYNFYKIKKSKDVPLKKACTDPKYVMDLILQNIRAERTLWGSDKYRILSFGEAVSTGRYKDSLGRTWITAYWVIGFDDKVNIMYILPMPDGPVVLSTMQNSVFLKDYEWDLKKLCDHIFSAYLAVFDDWTEFLTMSEFTPSFFKDINFRWNKTAKTLSYNCSGVKINLDSSVFDLSGDSELFLAPSWYKNKNKVEFGVRKIIVNKDIRGNDFFVIYRNIIPDSRLGTKAMENWNDIVIGKFPFDEKPTISARDNNGSVGGILNARKPGVDTLYSVYFEIEEPQSEENLSQRFNNLIKGISVVD